VGHVKFPEKEGEFGGISSTSTPTLGSSYGSSPLPPLTVSHNISSADMEDDDCIPVLHDRIGHIDWKVPMSAATISVFVRSIRTMKPLPQSSVTTAVPLSSSKSSFAIVTRLLPPARRANVAESQRESHPLPSGYPRRPSSRLSWSVHRERM